MKHTGFAVSLLVVTGLLVLCLHEFRAGEKPDVQSGDRTNAQPGVVHSGGEPDGPPPEQAVKPDPRVKRQGAVKRTRLGEMTDEQKAEYEKQFAEKLKPAVEKWCKVYEGHLPFRPEEVTPDKLAEELFPGTRFQSYTFVVNGITIGVDDENGEVSLGYLWTPAAKQLSEIPRDPQPPQDPVVGRDEILKLIKADSGYDFPAGEMSITPTSRGSSVNGGIWAAFGPGVNADYGPPHRYDLVFGPDGNLVSYNKCVPPAETQARFRQTWH